MKITNKNLLFIFAIIFFMISCSSTSKKVAEEKTSVPQNNVKVAEPVVQEKKEIVPKPEKPVVQEAIAPQNIESVETSYSTYRIKKGDCLYDIALSYSAPIWAIADFNQIENPNIISENKKLNLKNSWDDFVQNPNKKYYRIEIGETLFDIAKKLNINMNSLSLKNNISNVNMIYAGEKLLLP